MAWDWAKSTGNEQKYSCVKTVVQFGVKISVLCIQSQTIFACLLEDILICLLSNIFTRAVVGFGICLFPATTKVAQHFQQSFGSQNHTSNVSHILLM